MRKHFINIYNVYRTVHKKNHSPQTTIHGFSPNLEDMILLGNSLSKQYKKEYIIELIQYESGESYTPVHRRALWRSRNGQLVAP